MISTIDKLQLISGIDIPLPQYQTVIHQPTLKEISMIGEKNFFSALQLLNINVDKLSTQYNTQIEMSNFELLMNILKEQPNKKLDIMNFFTLLFPQYKLIITPRAFSFNGVNNNFILDEETFNDFQEILQLLFSTHTEEKEFNPQSKKAKEIASKLMRARERVAAQKRAEEGEPSLAQYITVIVIAVHSMSLQDVLGLTLYQLYQLLDRYNLYTAWDIELRSRLAGAKIDKKPENWMKPLK